MSSENEPLIVGAGPVGLAAALFLRRQGKSVRVVDLLDKPTEESRALAVNPRTLEILEPTEVTQQMLELGMRITGVCLHWQNGKSVTMSLAEIHPKYPFMLALSQASTERLLTRALERTGCTVERGVKFVDLRVDDEGLAAVLESTVAGTRTIKVAECPWLFAADGAHSTAREKLKMDFPGSSLEGEWYLADAPMRTRLAPDHAHVFLFDHGRFLFMLRVVDETQKNQPGEQIWRVISNRSEPLAKLAGAEQAGTPVWESSFRIAHRIVADMAAKGVFFAGDAAHIHSPMGARGMNLGIEDAWVFSELVRTGRMSEYDAMRHAIDKSVVRRVELLTRMVAAQSPFTRVARQVAFPVAMKTPVLRGRMFAAITGLDHDLPAFD